MQSIKANPESVENLFKNNYIIPDYQRPYSWNEEQCQQLWEDILNYFSDSQKNENYFLGTIVMYPEKAGSKTFNIIDGQQRITSLMLLASALFNHDKGNVKLKRCLFDSDTNTEEFFPDKLKVESRVINEDNQKFKNVIEGGDIEDKKSNYYKNYNIFRENIEKEIKGYGLLSQPDDFKKFVTIFLTQIQLLPIECNSFDNALTIFETINNRGLALSDNDIFKAKLYNLARSKNQEKDFIEQWQELILFEKENNKDGENFLFRNYMHYLRAKDETTKTEIALRKFFLGNNAQKLNDYNQVLNDLEVFTKAYDYLWENEDITIRNFAFVLKEYPNQYPLFPVYIFLHKNLEKQGDDFALSIKNKEEFIQLLKRIVAYSYVKYLVHRTVNSIKNDIYKVCKDIYHKGNYLATINESISVEEIKDAINNLKGQKSIRGSIYLGAILHPSQNNLIEEGREIEHILPKSHNHYDGWSKEEWEENIGRVGNLVPIEKKLNIKASNEFFDKKKEIYQNSSVQDARELCIHPVWNKQSIDTRENELIERLQNFFEGK